jgi:hypothetical protein
MFTFTLLVLFISGFAALLYQVAWQRMLVIFSGADVYSATIVVSARDSRRSGPPFMEQSLPT